MNDCMHCANCGSSWHETPRCSEPLNLFKLRLAAQDVLVDLQIDWYHESMAGAWPVDLDPYELRIERQEGWIRALEAGMIERSRQWAHEAPLIEPEIVRHGRAWDENAGCYVDIDWGTWV